METKREEEEVVIEFLQPMYLIDTRTTLRFSKMGVLVLIYGKNLTTHNT